MFGRPGFLVAATAARFAVAGVLHWGRKRRSRRSRFQRRRDGGDRASLAEQAASVLGLRITPEKVTPRTKATRGESVSLSISLEICQYRSRASTNRRTGSRNCTAAGANPSQAATRKEYGRAFVGLFLLTAALTCYGMSISSSRGDEISNASPLYNAQTFGPADMDLGSADAFTC
jgi:hypothetical protein